MRWPKYWSFSFSISPSNKYSRLISFRIDWFELLAVPGTLKSLLQHQSSKASIPWHSAFFMIQLSQPWLNKWSNICQYIWKWKWSCSVVSDSAAPWAAAHQASLSITNSWSFLKLMSIESVMPSNRLILCHPLFLLPSIFPSIRIFSSESVLRIRWPKYWHFSFSISPSNEYSGLISFKIDWFDLLTLQGTLKSLLQH